MLSHIGESILASTYQNWARHLKSVQLFLLAEVAPANIK